VCLHQEYAFTPVVRASACCAAILGSDRITRLRPRGISTSGEAARDRSQETKLSPCRNRPQTHSMGGADRVPRGRKSEVSDCSCAWLRGPVVWRPLRWVCAARSGILLPSAPLPFPVLPLTERKRAGSYGGQGR
jgi:hypothetical protein